MIPSPQAAVWVLFGRNLDQGPHIRALDRAFTRHFGDDYAAWFPDELFLTIQGGRLGLADSAGRPVTPPHIVYTRLSTVHLQSDREVTLLRHLELMGTTILNPIDAILSCVNKFWHLQTLAATGLPVPDSVSFATAPPENLLGAMSGTASISAPYMVKSVRGHRGGNVYLVPSADRYHDIHTNSPADVPLLAQAYVRHSHGRDLRIVIVDGEPIAAYVRQSTDGRVTSNVHQGGLRVHCLGVHSQAETLAVEAAKALDLTFAGVDLLFEEDGSFVICEINNNFAWETSTDDVPEAIATAIARRHPRSMPVAPTELASTSLDALLDIAPHAQEVPHPTSVLP